MMSPEDLHALCKQVHDKTTPVDEQLLDRIDGEVAEYRDRLRDHAEQTPPAELLERLPIMGWLLYEASLRLLFEIPAGFEQLPSQESAASLAKADLVARLTDAGRALPWPEYAPRALGTIRAAALVEFKRDSEAGYDAAWTLHEEARTKYREYLDCHADAPHRSRLTLALEEILLQLALAETGTACRTAEQVLGRWLDKWATVPVEEERRAADQWTQRLFRQLVDGVEVGRHALETAEHIYANPGFVDSVSADHLTTRTGFRNPAIMTCRAVLLVYSLCPEMRRQGLRPPQGGAWPEFMAMLLDTFHWALGLLRRPVERSDRSPVPLLDEHARTIVQVCLHLALLAAEETLDEPLRIDDSLTLHHLDDDAVRAMSQWLASPRPDGDKHGDAGIIGGASMPRFIESVEECRNDAGVAADYRRRRREWAQLDRYDRASRWAEIEAMLARNGRGSSTDGIALLIGSDHGGLGGVDNDLRTMANTLRARGFEIRECGPGEATRDGILAAYERLIADTRPGARVVVFYTGHGGFTEPSDTAAEEQTELQYILPVDFGKSGRDDFRGITSAELSVLQARLTAITSNVTVILDCCHSGLMSRDPSVTVKSLPPTPHDWVRRHLDRLEQQGLRTDLIPNEGNSRAVRVVACAPHQSAYVYRSAAGYRISVLSESLSQVLDEAGYEPVTWVDVLDRVRQRAAGLRVDQRPEVEGPSNRLIFSTEIADLLHSLPVTGEADPGRAVLRCAPLLRVSDGDEFMIMPAGSKRPDPVDRVGELTIDSVAAMSASGAVRFAPGWSSVPLGARAFRTRAQAPCIVVEIPLDAPLTERLLATLARVPLARAALPGEVGWTGRIAVGSDGGLTLHDRRGPLHPPYPPDEQGFAALADAIKILAQATELRRLIGDPSHPLDADVTVEWGLVVDGQARPLPTAGALVTPDQRIYVRIHNNGSTSVHVSLVDVGLSGQVCLIFGGAPAGRLLGPGRTVTLGYHEPTRTLGGSELRWPADLDPHHARPETILVVLTSQPQDLSALEQPGIVRTRDSESRGAGNGNRLRDLVDQVATGETREIGPDSYRDGVTYDIRAIDFEMTLDRTGGPETERGLT